jgi:hypothetical protein
MTGGPKGRQCVGPAVRHHNRFDKKGAEAAALLGPHASCVHLLYLVHARCVRSQEIAESVLSE